MTARTASIFAIAALGVTAAQAQTTTVKVDCRSSYLLQSVYDDGLPKPTVIRLADLGITAGDVITLTEKGKFSQSLNWPEDTDVVGAVFSRDNRFLDRTQRHRVPGAIKAGTSLISPCENSKMFLTDIAEDFAVAPEGTKVVVPSGAQYLFLGAMDSYYADNSSTSGLSVTITLNSTSKGRGRNLLQRILPKDAGVDSGATSIASNGLVSGWIGFKTPAMTTASQAAYFKSGKYVSADVFGGGSSIAYSITPNGDVAGSARETSGDVHSFINGLEISGDAGEAYAMNAKGTAVGYKNIWGGFNYPMATVKGEAQLIDTNYGQGTATAINDAGDVVGYYFGSDWKPVAFISYGNQSTRKAIPLKLPDNIGAYPTGINNKGQIVGYYVSPNYWTDQPYRQKIRSFILDDKGFRDLGNLPGGDTVEATAINNQGQVVGSANNADGETHAFVYNGKGIYDLGTLDGNESYATGINDKGTIVGTALDANGHTQAFSTDASTVVTQSTAPAPTAMKGMAFSNNYFPEGSTVTATISLGAAAPQGGLTLDLNVNKNVVSFPSQVVIPAGQTSVTFPVTGYNAEANSPFTLSATVNGQTVKADATVRSLTLKTFNLAVYNTKANTSVKGNLVLESAALKGGKTITLWTDNKAATVTASVTIAQGATNGSFTVQAGSLPVGTKVTVYAKCGDRQAQTAFTITK